jgi:hypothetical protein
MCFLLIYVQSLPTICHPTIVVSITVYCPELSDIRYNRMSSPIYESVVNWIVSHSIWRHPSKCINVKIGNVVLLVV